MSRQSFEKVLHLSRPVLVPVSLGAVAGTAWTLEKKVPIADWLAWQLVPLWIGIACFSLACVAAGYSLLRVLRCTHCIPTLETLVQSFALGLIAYTLLMYVAGALGWYHEWLAIALPAAMTASGAIPLLRFARERLNWQRAHGRQREASSRVWEFLAVSAGACCTLLVYLQVMTPDAINFDGAWYHLPAAQDYARRGNLAPFYTDYNRAFPQLASILYLWAWLVPGLEPARTWMLALHLEFMCFLWTLAGVAALARWMVGRRTPGTWAAFYLFPAIFVYDHNMGGAADHVLAVFAAPLFLSAARAAPALEPRRLLLTGIFLGGSLLTKYQAVYFVGCIAVLVCLPWALTLFRYRRTSLRSWPWLRIVGGPALAVAGVVLTSAPHFLKNLVYYKNPVYPFAMGLFSSSYPTHARTAEYMEHVYTDRTFQFQGSPWEKLGNALLMALRAPFEPHYSFTHNVPMLGYLFVLMMPFVLFVRPRRRILIAFAATYAATVVWAYAYFVDRYAQAIVPLMAGCVAAAIVLSWHSGWWTRIAMIPLVAFQIVYGGDAPFYNGSGRIEAAMALLRTTYEKRSTDRFDFRKPFVELTEQLPEDAVVVFHSNKPYVGLDRDILFDATQMQGLILYDNLHSAAALYDYYKSLGVTHIIWTTPSPPEHNKHSEVLIADFVTRFHGETFRAGHYTLSAMPPQRPSEQREPYRVLMVGTAYQDGLYELSQLTQHEMLPESVRGPLVAPRRPLDPQRQQLDSLVATADAVVLAHNQQHSVPRLGGEFTTGLRCSGHTVWIRVRR